MRMSACFKCKEEKTFAVNIDNFSPFSLAIKETLTAPLGSKAKKNVAKDWNNQF